MAIASQISLTDEALASIVLRILRLKDIHKGKDNPYHAVVFDPVISGVHRDITNRITTITTNGVTAARKGLEGKGIVIETAEGAAVFSLGNMITIDDLLRVGMIEEADAALAKLKPPMKEI